MKMKIKIYTLALTLLALLAGCSLEEKIYDNVVPETFIKRDADGAFHLKGVYSDFTT